MPLWDINYTAGGLSAQQRQSLADAITKIYTTLGLPPFYVQVRFRESAPTSLFVGGQDYSSTTGTNSQKHLSVQIVHVARSFDSETAKQRFLTKVDRVLNPLLDGKGWNWEYWVMEGPRELWKINGLVPPPTGSEMEKKWYKANRPLKSSTEEKL